MSRITQIELCDYRAFPGEKSVTTIDLHGRRHLLLYGENGSGKSSVGKALRDFFSRGRDPVRFGTLRHEFSNKRYRRGRVTLRFDDQQPLEWSLQRGRDLAHQLFDPMARTRAWLDYREIQRVFRKPAGALAADIFPLCMDLLLARVEMPGSTRAFGEAWSEFGLFAESLGNPATAAKEQKQALADLAAAFTKSLHAFLPELRDEANTFLGSFAEQTQLYLHLAQGLTPSATATAFGFVPPRIELRLNYRGHRVTEPESFLNEARLTACALSLYLAGLKRSAPVNLGDGVTYPRVLVLDDVLLSLDMDHRRPLLRVLQEHFSMWQVFLLTHSRAWYEIAKQRLPENEWQHTELFAIRVGDYETPLVREDKRHLERAVNFLAAGEPKAAAVHVRTQFELLLKEYCERLDIPVPFHRDLRKLTVRTLWSALSSHKDNLRPPPRIFFDRKRKPHIKTMHEREIAILPTELVDRIEHALSWVMNPLSHSESVERYRNEIFDAIFALEELESTLKSAAAGRMTNPDIGRDRLMELLVLRKEQLESPAPARKA